MRSIVTIQVTSARANSPAAVTITGGVRDRRPDR
jgi:hypothetical protein